MHDYVLEHMDVAIQVDNVALYDNCRRNFGHRMHDYVLELMDVTMQVDTKALCGIYRRILDIECTIMSSNTWTSQSRWVMRPSMTLPPQFRHRVHD